MMIHNRERSTSFGKPLLNRPNLDEKGNFKLDSPEMMNPKRERISSFGSSDLPKFG